jgi:chloramphenicol O-acetyltransferase type A
MHQIDLESWPRRKHFDKFKAFDHPHFGLCAQVDLSEFHPAVKGAGVSINIAIIYVLARAANSLPEFRQRIRGETVIEHEIVHPSSTILSSDDLFSFLTVEYSTDFFEFTSHATERMALMQANPSLEDEPGQDDLLFMTAIPWVSFSSFKHPVHLHPADSVPRIAWGKFFQDGANWKMPVDVQAHHALMDGIHLGRFYDVAQELFSNPENFLP